MRIQSRLVYLSLIVGLSACSRDPMSPSGPPASGSGEIRGTERLGWDQRAASAAELASFRYAIYVDSARTEATGVSCASTAGPSGYACSSRFPPMSPGVHTIELATFVLVGGTPVESSRSAPLRITVTGLTAGAVDTTAAAGRSPTPEPNRASPRRLVTADGTRLRVDVVADGFVDPTDLAFAPGGRLLVAERRGVVWAMADAHVDPEPALLVEDTRTDGARGGLLALALAPDFDSSRFLYVLQTAIGDAGAPVFRIVRFREAGGVFGERAVLMDGVPASPDPGGSIRFGPDGKLYVALDDGGDPDQGGRLSSPNGKILRLNPDGTTPDDQPAANPAVSSGLRSPQGFDWHPGTGVLWLADAPPGGPSHLQAVVPGARELPAARRAVHVLSDRVSGTGAAFYRGAELPAFSGDLLVASKGTHGLLRIRLEATDSRRVASTEHLLQAYPGGIQAIAVGSDGAVYLATATALIRLRSSD